MATQSATACFGCKSFCKIVQHISLGNPEKRHSDMLQGCACCAILNAKRLRAHKHFRTKVFEGPRITWAFDYHGVTASDEGYREVLGDIDLVTGELRLFATKDRSAAITTDCILQGVILRDGVPLVIHSDHAREFISKLLATLEKALGVTATTTLAHHPTGNSKIERV